MADHLLKKEKAKKIFCDYRFIKENCKNHSTFKVKDDFEFVIQSNYIILGYL